MKTSKQQKLEAAGWRVGSSQSRVAKMEVADRSVSMELLIRSLVTMGATRSQIGQIVGTRKVRRTTASKK